MRHFCELLGVKKAPPRGFFFCHVEKSLYFCRRKLTNKSMKSENPKPEKGTLRWWVHLIIAILSAIAGALGGALVIAPALTLIP